MARDSAKEVLASAPLALRPSIHASTSARSAPCPRSLPARRAQHRLSARIHPAHPHMPALDPSLGASQPEIGPRARTGPASECARALAQPPRLPLPLPHEHYSHARAWRPPSVYIPPDRPMHSPRLLMRRSQRSHSLFSHSPCVCPSLTQAGARACCNRCP